jgi:hypothetical protein
VDVKSIEIGGGNDKGVDVDDDDIVITNGTAVHESSPVPSSVYNIDDIPVPLVSLIVVLIMLTNDE